MKFLLMGFLMISSFLQPKAGLEGFLRESRGNQMGKQKPFEISGHPFSSKIYLYKKLSSIDLVGLEGNWCDSVQQKPYKIIQTNNKGYFKIHLMPGKYMVLVGAYDGFFVPYFDQNNQPASITIQSGKIEQMKILVNSKAIY